MKRELPEIYTKVPKPLYTVARLAMLRQPQGRDPDTIGYMINAPDAAYTGIILTWGQNGIFIHQETDPLTVWIGSGAGRETSLGEWTWPMFRDDTTNLLDLLDRFHQGVLGSPA